MYQGYWVKVTEMGAKKTSLQMLFVGDLHLIERQSSLCVIIVSCTYHML